MLLAAAGAEAKRPRAEALLLEAFNIHAERRIWPDFGLMERVVRRAAELGYDTHARELADRMAKLAETTEYPFEVFGHIDAASALYFAGADATEVVAYLDAAESLFPADPSKVVSFGLISGPMQWGASGLARDARWQIALVGARIGDTDRAIRMLDGVDEPVAAWLYLTGEKLPVSNLSVLTAFAKEALPPHEYAYVAGQLARFAAEPERSEQHRDWALKLARELAATGKTNGERSVLIHGSLARVAFGAGDTDLGGKLLARMADARLVRNWVPVIGLDPCGKKVARMRQSGQFC